MPKRIARLGRANQIDFDAGQDEFHILPTLETYDGNFKILGVGFDVA